MKGHIYNKEGDKLMVAQQERNLQKGIECISRRSFLKVAGSVVIGMGGDDWAVFNKKPASYDSMLYS